MVQDSFQQQYVSLLESIYVQFLDVILFFVVV